MSALLYFLLPGPAILASTVCWVFEQLRNSEPVHPILGRAYRRRRSTFMPPSTPFFITLLCRLRTPPSAPVYVCVTTLNRPFYFAAIQHIQTPYLIFVPID